MDLQRYIRGIRNKQFKKNKEFKKMKKLLVIFALVAATFASAENTRAIPNQSINVTRNCKAIVEQAWVFGTAVPARCQAFNLDQSNKAQSAVKQTASRNSVAIKVSKHRSSIAAKQG